MNIYFITNKNKIIFFILHQFKYEIPSTATSLRDSIKMIRINTTLKCIHVCTNK